MKTVNGTGRHGSQPPSLTGRDGYIVGQALYWFIREQQKLPKSRKAPWHLDRRPHRDRLRR